jgi:exoribonuclease R
VVGANHDLDMVQIARRVLREHGFEPDLPPGLDATVPAIDPTDNSIDLRYSPWSSIDNPESRDLDQIEAAEPLAGGRTRLVIGIADVDALAPIDSRIDKAAAINTMTLYTA